MKRISVSLCEMVMIGFCILASIPQVLASPVYTMTNGSTYQSVDPLSKAESAGDYYGYVVSESSGFPDFGTQSGVGFFWLYENTLNGDTSLGMIFDTTNDGSGGTVEITISGVPGTGFIEVVDDPKTIPTADEFTVAFGNWYWAPCCADGGVIGGLDGLWEITIGLDYSSGMGEWLFLDGPSYSTPTSISLDMTKNLVISSVPIPGAIWFLGSGLVVLAGLRKRLKS
jgi:hypothetical protein